MQLPRATRPSALPFNHPLSKKQCGLIGDVARAPMLSAPSHVALCHWPAASMQAILPSWENHDPRRPGGAGSSWHGAETEGTGRYSRSSPKQTVSFDLSTGLSWPWACVGMIGCTGLEIGRARPRELAQWGRWAVKGSERWMCTSASRGSFRLC